MTRHFPKDRQVTLREPIPISTSQRISIQISPGQPHNAQVFLIQSEGYMNDTMFNNSGNEVNVSYEQDDSIPLCSYRVQQLSTNKLQILRKLEDEEVIIRELNITLDELTRTVYDTILVEDVLGFVVPTEQESKLE